MTQENRRNFSVKVINEVFEEQGRACAKCGNPILHGFHAHHKNGINSDNTKENCQLLCKSCHGGEKYATLQAQKQKVIESLDKLVQVGIEGKVSGASIDKLLDAIKMSLSLQGQLFEEEYFSSPPELRLEYSYVIAENGLKKYEEGYLAGLSKNIELSEGAKRSIENMRRE